MPKASSIAGSQAALFGLAVALTGCGCYLDHQHRATVRSILASGSYEDLMELRASVWHGLQPKLSVFLIGLAAIPFAASLTLTALWRGVFSFAATAVCGAAVVGG